MIRLNLFLKTKLEYERGLKRPYMQKQTDPLDKIQIIVQHISYYYFFLHILQTSYKNIGWTSHSILALFGAPFGVSKMRWKVDHKKYVIRSSLTLLGILYRSLKTVFSLVPIVIVC